MPPEPPSTTRSPVWIGVAPAAISTPVLDFSQVVPVVFTFSSRRSCCEVMNAAPPAVTLSAPPLCKAMSLRSAMTMPPMLAPVACGSGTTGAISTVTPASVVKAPPAARVTVSVVAVAAVMVR